MAQQVWIVGGGFAGVWAALGAARAARTLEADVEVTLVSADPWLTLRPRLYEASFRDARVWLDRILGPVGVRRLQGQVTQIDAQRAVVSFIDRHGVQRMQAWDGMVLAAGSEVVRPGIPGLSEHAFSVDTYDDAVALDDALDTRRAEGGPAPKVTVVGGGFAGLEVAAEMVARLRSRWPRATSRVTIVDRSAVVGAELGPGPRPEIEKALSSLGIQLVLERAVTAISSSAVTLDNGAHVDGDVVVWTAGLRANRLAAQLGVPVDEVGRVTVDRGLRVVGLNRIWAAGDVAHASTDGANVALQSCQHAQPQGRVAGHNVVASLAGAAEVPYEQLEYVTCLDLGPAGAVFTRGWDRKIHAVGAEAKAIKRRINWERIVPPTTGQVDDLLAAAAPTFNSVRA